MSLPPIKFFQLLLTAGILLGRGSAQVASLPSPEPGPSETETRYSDDSGGSPDDRGREGKGGALPAAELIGTDDTVFIIPGVVNLGELSGRGVLFGAGASQGYGWLSGPQTGNQHGSISVVQPYVGLYDSGYRHKILFEYAPTVDLFNQHKFDGSVLQRGGLRGYRMLSPRWAWIFHTFTTNGREYIRELDGLAIGEYPGWLTFAQPSSSLLMTTESTAFKFHPTPRHLLSFMMMDTYSAIEHGPHYDAGTGRVQFTDYFKRDSDVYVFAQATRYSNQPGCTRIGSGVGFFLNFSASTTLAMESGPVYGQGTCVNHLTANFSGALAQHITSSIVFVLSATRDITEPYLLQSRWNDIYAAKFRVKLNRNMLASVGTAYTRSSTLPGESEPLYRAFLAFSELQWRLSDTLSLTATYRYFKRAIDQPGFDDRHTWVFASVVWHPPTRARRHF